MPRGGKPGKHNYPERRKRPRSHSVKAYDRGWTDWEGASQGEAFDKMHKAQEEQSKESVSDFKTIGTTQKKLNKPGQKFDMGSISFKRRKK